MKKILLTKGKYTKVDDEDFDFLNQWKWMCTFDGRAKRRIYIKKIDGKWIFKDIMMSSLIMNCPDDKIVDHMNRDRLDNQKSNLRICTNSQNQCNKKNTIRNTSGYKGVLWCKTHKKWRSIIMKNKKVHYLGYFTDLIEAAKAYDVGAKKYHKKFAVLNFSC